MSLHVVEPGGVSAVFHRGDRLRKARETARIQVQRMADLLGVERGAIRRYERNVGVRRMVVEAYAKHTGFDEFWLEHGGPDDGGGGHADTRTPNLGYTCTVERLPARHLVAA